MELRWKKRERNENKKATNDQVEKVKIEKVFY